MTSTGAPTFILGASDSRTLAISHTVERLPTVKTGSLAPTLMYWPSPTLRWMIVPPIGAHTIDLGADAVGLLELRDLLVRAAEDAQPVAHGGERDLGRAQVALRAHEIGLRLLEVLERAAADRLQVALPLLGGLRQQSAASAPSRRRRRR